MTLASSWLGSRQYENFSCWSTVGFAGNQGEHRGRISQQIKERGAGEAQCDLGNIQLQPLYNVHLYMHSSFNFGLRTTVSSSVRSADEQGSQWISPIAMSCLLCQVLVSFPLMTVDLCSALPTITSTSKAGVISAQEQTNLQLPARQQSPAALHR